MGGTLMATALAIVTGLIGGTGKDGAAVFLLVLALTSALIGLVGMFTLLRDEYHDVAPSRGRIVLTVTGFFAATLLMAMVVGVGG
jgi:hypothetical protein